MATLNEIVYNIAETVGKGLDVILRERLKFTVKYYRAEFIRQDIERNGISSVFQQRFTAKLVKTDLADSCALTVGCTVLKTEKPIPTPVRIKTSGGLFKYVGTADFADAFSYREVQELKYSKYNKFTGNSISYDYKNNHIYVFNNTKIKFVTVQGIFEDPESVNSCASEVCYTDDSPYPISADMIRRITLGIRSGELAIMTPDREVDVQEDGSSISNGKK